MKYRANYSFRHAVRQVLEASIGAGLVRVQIIAPIDITESSISSAKRSRRDEGRETDSLGHAFWAMGFSGDGEWRDGAWRDGAWRDGAWRPRRGLHLCIRLRPRQFSDRPSLCS